MSDDINQLQQNITDNDIYANRVVNESVSILNVARNTYDKFNNLQVKYKKAKQDLNTNFNKVKSSKQRAQELFTKALNLVARVTKTQEEIERLENTAHGDDLSLLEAQLADLIRRMNGYTGNIEEMVKYYKICP